MTAGIPMWGWDMSGSLNPPSGKGLAPETKDRLIRIADDVLAGKYRRVTDVDAAIKIVEDEIKKIHRGPCGKIIIVTE